MAAIPPADTGARQDERLFPSGPQPSQDNPEQLIRRGESPPRTEGVKNEELLTQGEVFKDKVWAGSECANNPAEEVPEQHDHERNLTG